MCHIDSIRDLESEYSYWYENIVFPFNMAQLNGREILAPKRKEMFDEYSAQVEKTGKLKIEEIIKLAAKKLGIDVSELEDCRSRYPYDKFFPSGY